MGRKPLVVVGSVNLDFVCSVDRIPAPGETIPGDRFQTFHGGKGANQAVAVARLGYPVSMVAKVGDDAFGKRLRAGLRSAGVDIRHVTTIEATSSGVALICADKHGQNSIVVVAGANGKLQPADLDKAAPLLRSAGMILTQLEIPFETIEHLATLAGRFAVPLILDPAPARKLSDQLLRQVAYLTPNETEARIICGLGPEQVNPSTAPEIARRLVSRGPRHVLIKMGSRGVYAATAQNDGVFLPAFKVQVVDSTAAGDAFNGGLAVALMHGQNLEKAACFASAVAAVSVTRMGAQPSMPTARQVRLLLKEAARSAGPESLTVSSF